MERQIRSSKVQQNALKAAGDTEGAKALEQRIALKNKQLKAYCDSNKLSYRRDRTEVYGYKKKLEIADTIDKSLESDIIKSSGISGAINPTSKRAQTHANKFYETVRYMKTDVSKIAQNTGFKEKEIEEIKDFIFYQKHDLGGVEPEYFYPNYEMSQSWQRLIDGKNIQKHDITLLQHEAKERNLMKQGYSQGTAHRMAEIKYNYSKESEEYYAKINKLKNE